MFTKYEIISKVEWLHLVTNSHLSHSVLKTTKRRTFKYVNHNMVTVNNVFKTLDFQNSSIQFLSLHPPANPTNGGRAQVFSPI